MKHRRRLPFGLSLCLALTLRAATQEPPPRDDATPCGKIGSDHPFVQVEDYTNGGDGTKASPWTGVDGVGGIERALNACDNNATSGVNRDGCTLILPKGFVKITRTIEVAYDDSLEANDHQYGLIFRGHGSGVRGEPTPTTTFAGTSLVWEPAPPREGQQPDDTILRILNTSWSVFEDFLVDGADKATTGISLTADLGVSMNNILRNITIEGIDGVGLYVGPPDGGRPHQVSETVVEKVFIDDVETGVVQEGQQTADIHYRSVDISDFKEYGMDFRGGPVYTQGCMFVNGKHSSKADVRVRSGEDVDAWRALWAIFENNYHETFSGSAYLFCDGADCVSDDPVDEQGAVRKHPTTFINTRVNWFQESGNIIDYRHAGPINLIGCTFDLGGIFRTQTGLIRIGPSAGVNVRVSTTGNFYDRRRSPGIKMSFGANGSAYVVSNDDATDVGAQGLIVASDGGPLFQLDQDGKIVMYRADAQIRFQATPGSIGFKNNALAQTTVLGAVDATASRTVLLPDSSGMVVLDSTRPEVCGSVNVDPPSIASGSSGAGSAPVTGLTSGSACACSPVSEWHEDLIMKYCNSTSDTLRVRLYNAGQSDIDARGRIVSFCCRQ